MLATLLEIGEVESTRSFITHSHLLLVLLTIPFTLSRVMLQVRVVHFGSAQLLTVDDSEE